MFLINQELFKPRTCIAKFEPLKKERIGKIVKNDSPSPTSYETEKSYEKVKGHNLSF